jgi:hypothetical protein
MEEVLRWWDQVSMKGCRVVVLAGWVVLPEGMNWVRKR